MFAGILFGYIGLISIITMVLFGIDKNKAISHQWRIKESTLLGLCFIGGALGGLVGMSVFRHKTKKMKFFVGVPAAFIINVCVAVVLCYFFGGK